MWLESGWALFTPDAIVCNYFCLCAPIPLNWTLIYSWLEHLHFFFYPWQKQKRYNNSKNVPSFADAFLLKGVCIYRIQLYSQRTVRYTISCLFIANCYSVGEKQSQIILIGTQLMSLTPSKRTDKRSPTARRSTIFPDRKAESPRWNSLAYLTDWSLTRKNKVLRRRLFCIIIT